MNTRTKLKPVLDFGSPDNPITIKQWDKKYGQATSQDSNPFSITSNIDIRTSYIQRCGYSIVTKELVDALKPYCKGNVVEVGSGSGWLAAHLRQAGVKMSCYDNRSWNVYKTLTPHTAIIEGDGPANVRKADTVIMSWPDYNTPFAKRVIDSMSCGARLLYCGEDEDGCTGDKMFHYTLAKSWEENKEFGIELKAIHKVFNSLHYIHDNWKMFTKTRATRLSKSRREDEV